MEFSIQFRKVLRLFIIFNCVNYVSTKPAGFTEKVKVEEDVSSTSHLSLISQKEVQDADYSYNWSFDGSGFPSYSDDGTSAQRSCPTFCTCIVETVVHCSRQGITSIGGEEDSLDSKKKILNAAFPASTTAVYLGYNNLTTLPTRLFHSLTEDGQNNIEELFLQHNLIAKIDPDTFASIPNLKTLDLSYNLISRLFQPRGSIRNESTFNPEVANSQKISWTSVLDSVSSTLISLNLNRNAIKGIPNNSFKSLPNLETLTLSWNKITWISRRAFSGLHKLKVLQLRANPLGVKTVAKLGSILQHFITGKILVSQEEMFPPGLEEFKFYPKENFVSGAASRRTHRKRRNSGESGDGEFKSRKKAETYRTVRLNSLIELDLGETNLFSFPSALPTSLKRLYLDSNRISKVPSRVLRTVKWLEILQLGGNHIKSFEDRTFSSLYSLQVLDMSRNNLTQLTPNSFSGLLRLTSLRLYGNQELSVLPKRIFHSLPSLRLLYLHDCNLTSIPTGPWIFRIMALWLYGNPIECECRTLLALLVRLYQPFQPKLTLRMDPYRSVLWDDFDTWKHQRPEKTTCFSPDNFRGHRIEDVRIRDMRCTYYETYNAEISRRIAGSKFVNKDYQQDESTTTRNSGDLILDEREDGVEELMAKLDDADIWDDVGKNIKELLSEEDISPLKPVVVPELNIPNITDLSHASISNEELEKSLNVVEPNMVIPAEVELLNQHLKKLNGILSSYTDDDMGIQNDFDGALTGEDMADDHSAGTEWLIEFPAGASVEDPDRAELEANKHNIGSDNPTNDDQSAADKVERESLTREGRISSDVSSAEISNLPSEIAEIQSNSKQLNKWEEYPQGFAEYLNYDDGDVILDLNFAQPYGEEVRATMNATDIARLNEHLEKYDAWLAFQDYYSDSESSGFDYEQSLYDFNFGMQVKELAEGGASFDQVLGNLSEMYNVSLEDLSVSTTGSPEGEILEYEDW